MAMRQVPADAVGKDPSAKVMEDVLRVQGITYCEYYYIARRAVYLGMVVGGALGRLQVSV